ncbi:hypothetical protein, partial [Xenorhabdus bovienii]|uniref:hypothetical protein n=1 Tax=Xenorhabdus bovienii TaxID=40576 RepID=UPI0023B2DFDE
MYGFVHNYALAGKRLCTIVGVSREEESDFYSVEAKTALRGVEAVLTTGVMLNTWAFFVLPLDGIFR